MNSFRSYPSEYYPDTLSYDSNDINNDDCTYPCTWLRYVPYNMIFDEMEDDSRLDLMPSGMSIAPIVLKDYGSQPFVVNIDEATKQNNNFRTALWTGKHLQVTLMSIDVDDDIGLEIHTDVDQFLRIEDGQGIVRMGKNKDNLDFQANASDDFAIMVPAGTWHNVINTGNKPLKIYAIYAPPQHPHGVVNVTKPAE